MERVKVDVIAPGFELLKTVQTKETQYVLRHRSFM
jgi:hypothetical protein